MQSIYQKRLRVLEQQAAKFGAYAPAHVVVEIDDLQHQLAGLSEKLAPLAPELAVGRRLMASIHRSKGIVDAPRQLIGRDYLLVRIHAALDRGSRLLLYGLAGVGKTAIAAVVADQRISMGKGPVVWLQCGQASTDMVLDALWQRFASREKSRGILHLENLHDRVLTVRDLLAVAEIGLLVLDNVWNGAALYAALEAVPPGLPVLATAREKFALPEAIEVGELEPDAALNLLSFYAERDDLATDPEASRLCQELGYHAYALEIAGVTMRIDDYTPGELQLQIAKSPHNLPMPGNFAAEGRQSVKHLLDFSYQTLTEEERDLCQAFGALFAPGATADLLAEYVQQPLLHVDRMLKTLMRRSLVKHRRDQGHPFYALHALTYSYFGALHRQRGVGYQSTIAATVRYVRNHGEDLTLLALDQRNILGAA
ncbi:MAG: hypothetical protein DCC55_32035, partial [Chloroflexi bacterium]